MVSITAVGSGLFMRLCMVFSCLLLVFALEYKLFLISFASRRTPHSLQWIPSMTLARSLPLVLSRKTFVLMKFVSV